MNKLPTFDEKQLPKNPFSFSIKIEVSKRFDDSKFITDKDGIKLPVSNYIEKTKSTKIYHCAGMTDKVCELSDKSQRLYLYIIHTLQPNKDYIRINVPLYLTRNNIKDIRTYKAAVTELVNKEYLVLTTFENVYHINPNYFFNGSRINKYKSRIEVLNEYSI